jgi:hypothetical protein
LLLVPFLCTLKGINTLKGIKTLRNRKNTLKGIKANKEN